jgi:integrase
LRLTVDDLALLYLGHCNTYYRKDGELTGEADNIRRALRPLIASFGRKRAREIEPAALLKARESMVHAGFVRRAINIHVSRIRRMFRWAVERELLPVTVWQSLCAVSGLSKGRSPARESTLVLPVDDGTVNDTLPHLSRVVAEMVRLQLLCGMRPGEVCSLRPCDLTIGTDGVWTYRPDRHKTEHHGRARRIFIGPNGQAVLRQYLDRDSEAYCFTPADAVAERSAHRRRPCANRSRGRSGVDIPKTPTTGPFAAPAKWHSACRRNCGTSAGPLREWPTYQQKSGMNCGKNECRGCRVASETLLESESTPTQPSDGHPGTVRHRRTPARRLRTGAEEFTVVVVPSAWRLSVVRGAKDCG